VESSKIEFIDSTVTKFIFYVRGCCTDYWVPFSIKWCRWLGENKNQKPEKWCCCDF